MFCPQCQQQGMRLVRYDNGLDIWACRHCDHESPLLDCPMCERRGVRNLGANDQGVDVWQCNACRHSKFRCPKCQSGWIYPPEQAGVAAQCDSCQHTWEQTADLGELPSSH